MKLHSWFFLYEQLQFINVCGGDMPHSLSLQQDSANELALGGKL